MDAPVSLKLVITTLAAYAVSVEAACRVLAAGEACDLPTTCGNICTDAYVNCLRNSC